MAVKFSEFTEETVASNITGIVGYVASSNLNVRIAPADLNTSYDLTATDNATNNVPLVLTGSDSTADTVNFVGAGGIQLSSTGNVVTVTSDARVDSFTNANGTYVSATTANTAATGAVTVGTVDLSAIDGVDTSTRFLSKDNVWSIVDPGVTSFTNANGTYVSAGTVNTAADGAVTVGAIDLSAIDGTADATTRFLSKDNTWDVPEIGVTSFTNADGTYISAGTVNTAADGAVTIGTVDLSAIDGTSDLTTRFLSKDNTWDVVDRITGSGTANIVPLWTTTTNLGNSVIAQDGTNIGIGTTSPASKLTTYGAANTIVSNVSAPLATSNSVLFGVSDTGATKAGLGFTKKDGFRRGDLFLFNNNDANDSTDGSASDARLTITSAGQIQFNEYTSASAFTGTAVANLAVDSSGNIITEAAGGLAVVDVAAGATVAAAASTLYVFTASSGSVSTLTLPASPAVGDTIKISNIGGLANIVGANTNNIMGVSTDMTIDVATSSFELIWTGISATGWVILSNV